MRPIIQLGLAAFLTAASFTASPAQDKADSDRKDGNCFGVVMPATGNLGSILVDRCSGKTWMLARSTPKEGYTLRWYPISVETNEYILRK
jgi:hypothetical protein